jgi:hypothetical protein
MWDPVGPLPATVYWRRRWLAIASTVATVVLVLWSVAAFFTPAEPVLQASSHTAQIAPQQPPPAPPTTGPVAPPSTSSQPGAPGSATPTPTAGPSTAATSEQLRPDETPRQSVPVPSPVPVPPKGPVQCANPMIAVAAEIDRPEHRVGERPMLRLVVTNVSDQPCVRDLDPARQEIVVWSGDGATRLWSSNDCVNASSADLRTLVPGQPTVFAVTWAGRTSKPGCAQARTEVPAGDYRVMTRVDDVISPPTPFTRRA